MPEFKFPSRRLATEIRIQKAIEVIKARGVRDDNCPRCGKFDWNVDLLHIPANSDMLRPSAVGFQVQQPASARTTGVLSVLSMACKNCGYTIFHTLNVLGI